MSDSESDPETFEVEKIVDFRRENVFCSLTREKNIISSNGKDTAAMTTLGKEPRI
jgi:hypothetical protein